MSNDPKNRRADGSDNPGAGGGGSSEGADKDESAKKEEAARLEKTLAEHSEMRADLAEIVEFLGKKFPKDIREDEEVNAVLKRLLNELLDRRKNAGAAIAAPAKPLGKPLVRAKKLFRALADGTWADPRGGVHRVTKGKIFDSRHYDIGLIQKCGVQLEDVTPKDE